MVEHSRNPAAPPTAPIDNGVDNEIPKKRYEGRYFGRPVMDFQNHTLELNADLNWRLNDKQLAVLWRVEYPNATGRIDESIVHGVRRLYNRGKHNNDIPETPSIRYESNAAGLRPAATPVAIRLDAPDERSDAERDAFRRYRGDGRPLPENMTVLAGAQRVALDEVVSDPLERQIAVEVSAEQVESGRGKDLESDDSGWLAGFTEAGVREVFRHIDRFGGVNEADATQMLGGPRKFRHFSQKFEEHAERAPFGVRIDMSSGQKRYVRAGGSTSP